MLKTGNSSQATPWAPEHQPSSHAHSTYYSTAPFYVQQKLGSNFIFWKRVLHRKGNVFFFGIWWCNRRMLALQLDRKISWAIFRTFGPVRCAEALPVLFPGRHCS